MGFMPTIVEPFAFQPDRWVSHIQDFSGGGPSADSDALLWKAAVVAAGGTVSDPRLALVSTLIGSLKSAGVWTLLDRLWLLAAENSQSALIDLVARASATAVNSPTFTADQGYTGNGTTNYIDTNFNLSTATKFLQNDAHFMVWRRLAATTGGGGRVDGVTVGSASSSSYAQYPNSSLPTTGQINGPQDASEAIFTGSVGVGSHAMVRTGAAAVQSYLNGAATGTSSAASLVPPNLTFFLLGRNQNGGGVQQFSNAQDMAFSAGGSLTATQALALHNAINTYKTAIGA